MDEQGSDKKNSQREVEITNRSSPAGVLCVTSELQAYYSLQLVIIHHTCM